MWEMRCGDGKRAKETAQECYSQSPERVGKKKNSETNKRTEEAEKQRSRADHYHSSFAFSCPLCASVGSHSSRQPGRCNAATDRVNY